MSENEIMLINLIRQHKNPEEALATAVKIIIDYISNPKLENTTIDCA